MMHELFPLIVFYGFAGLALVSALLVITQNNPVRCVLFLVLTFFATAALWILQDAEFLALILVLVYVGAVMTLFLFVVMMLNIDVESLKGHFVRYLPFGLILVALLVSLLIISLPSGGFKRMTINPVALMVPTPTGEENAAVNPVASEPPQVYKAPELSNTEQIGMVLYTDYLLAFELAAVLLLVAIVAAVTLSQRHMVRSKKQNIVKQMLTNKRDRVRLVP